MTLRNAFDAVATEGTLRAINRRLQTFVTDISGNLRTVVTNTVVTNSNLGAGNSITTVNTAQTPQRLYFDASAVLMMDERERQREMTRQSAYTTRQRWTIT